MKINVFKVSAVFLRYIYFGINFGNTVYSNSHRTARAGCYKFIGVARSGVYIYSACRGRVYFHSVSAIILLRKHVVGIYGNYKAPLSYGCLFNLGVFACYVLGKGSSAEAQQCNEQYEHCGNNENSLISALFLFFHFSFSFWKFFYLCKRAD